MNTKLLLFLTFNIIYNSCAASEDSSIKKFSIDYSLQWNHTLNTITDSRKLIEFNENSYVSKIREINKSINSSKYITDNPLSHGASYASILFKFQPINSLKLSIELLGEHRGSSYGFLNYKNIAFFPLFSIDFKDSIDILNSIFKAKKNNIFFKGGLLTKIKIDEGIMIYNTDAHGYQLGLRLNNFEFSRSHYGDFVNYIGLNIDDFINYNFKYYLKDSIYLSSSYTIANEVYNKSNNNNSVFSISGRYKKFYTSIAYRYSNVNKINDYYLETYDNFYNTNLNNYSVNFIEPFSFLVGYQNKFKNKKSTTELLSEIRFYGKFFNFNRINNAKKYRNISQSISYANTIGENLYPIYRTNYSFSQWNVFTEYVGQNIIGLNLDLKHEHNLYKKLFFDIQIDANILKPFNESYTILAFYRTGLKLKIIDNSEVFVGVTNKTMNLDIHYPSFYNSKEILPVINIRKWIY